MNLKALPFTIVGLAFVAWAISDMVPGFQSSHWPTVSAKIETFDIHRSSGRRHQSTPRVTYSYQVSGITYTGHRIGLGSDQGKRYKVGSTELVHYSPEEPTVAVLEPGIRWPAWATLGFGLVFAAIGSLVMFGILPSNAATRGGKRSRS